MHPDRKAMAVGIGVAVAVALAIFVWLFASLARDGKGSGKEKEEVAKEEGKKKTENTTPEVAPVPKPKPTQLPTHTRGIDVEKVLWHLTNESDTAILFDTQGAVVSTTKKIVLDFDFSESHMADAAKLHVPAVQNMTGHVMAVRSIKGSGNRFTREKAEAVLTDAIRHQRP